MVPKSASLAIGLPHSGHSGRVSGGCSSSMVLGTSTNGTSATMPANNSPDRLATAPISMPPALPPWPTMRFSFVYLASISARAVAAPPKMGDGVEKAAVDQRQRVGGKRRRHRHAVGAVAVEQQRRFAVAHQ